MSNEQVLIPNAIQWHDGMMLSPQHLQQAFLREERLCQYQFENIFSFSYGVIKFKIDNNALITGIFRVVELECIMPDRLVVTYNQELDRILEIDLNEYIHLFKKQEQYVYLSIPLYKKVNSISNDEFARFRPISPELAVDDNTGGEEISIPRLRPRIKLNIGEVEPAHYVSLALAKISLAQTSFSIENFWPAFLHTSKEMPAWQKCYDLVHNLRQKIKILIDRINEYGEKLKQNQKYILINLKSTVLKFEVLLKSNISHPYFLYLELQLVLGAVSQIDSFMDLPDAIPYNHKDIFSCFNKVINKIYEILEREMPSKYEIILFNNNEINFNVNIDYKKISNDEIIIGFKKSHSISKDKLLNWINSVIICNSKKVDIMQERRVLGFNRSIVDFLPDLEPQKDVILVTIKCIPDSFKDDSLLVVVSNTLEKINEFSQEIYYYQRKE
ncbi:MAG: type VI secretion system baseplate subunit TssK [Silvanigrellaceae bacterium]|nr:type VI secretion system baseplate subunit TssK [Silvanigrellaceae bacterium]